MHAYGWIGNLDFNDCNEFCLFCPLWMGKGHFLSILYEPSIYHPRNHQQFTCQNSAIRSELSWTGLAHQRGVSTFGLFAMFGNITQKITYWESSPNIWRKNVIKKMSSRFSDNWQHLLWKSHFLSMQWFMLRISSLLIHQ